MNPIAQKMEEGADSGVFPRAVLLVHHRRRIVFHEACGSPSISPDPVPMSIETLFDLASLTKPLATAAAIAFLIQEKVLALEDPVSKFIPEFLTGAKREATLFHLLNHGSGLPDWKPYYQEIIRLAEKEPGYLGSSSAKTRVYKMAHDEPLISFPGEKSLYSEMGFILWGEMGKKPGGDPLHRFCYRHIFSKLKTRETFFIPLGRTPRPFRGRTFAATEACPWR